MDIVERLADPSNRSSRDGHQVKMVVVHGDAGQTDEGTLSWLENPAANVSYHYLIGRDGTVYQTCPEDEKAWHAGVSEWLGATVGNSVNPTSIGVSYANRGPGENFQRVQYQAMGALIARIMARYGVPLDRVRGHYEVSPGRKTDPWPHHDWHELYGWIGYHFSGRTP